MKNYLISGFSLIILGPILVRVCSNIIFAAHKNPDWSGDELANHMASMLAKEISISAVIVVTGFGIILYGIVSRYKKDKNNLGM